MLTRPGLLLNPWAIRQTQTTVQTAAAGQAYERRAQEGDAVTINGAGFHSTQGSGRVRFNDGAGGFLTAAITSWGNTQIVCTVPTGAVSSATDGVWVYQDSIDSNKEAFTVVLPSPSIDDLEQL